MEVSILRADPAGNITVFVLNPVAQEQRPAVATQIMAMAALHCEQVGFVCPPQQGGDGRMEMAGGEFCGNATRAFGLLVSRKRGNLPHVKVETSGCHGLVGVDVEADGGTARAEMPLPQSVTPMQVGETAGTLVHLEGIAHLVVEDVAPSEVFFSQAEPLFQNISGLGAYGVIFLDLHTNQMTPLVKVPALQSLIWEGSCGSGSLAAAVAQNLGGADGDFVVEYMQPAGAITVTLTRAGGRVTAAYIGGAVTLDKPIHVELN